MTTKLFVITTLALVLHANVQLNNRDLKVYTNNNDWQSLFNGKDLTNWVIRCTEEDKDRNFWSVENGTIMVNSIGSTDHGYIWLQTQKEYADFELHLKFQSFKENTGNSGVQIRSRYDVDAKVDHENGIGWLDGPQIDIHTPEPWRTGLIYDETRGHRRWIYPDLPDWKIDKATYAPDEFRQYFADEYPYWNELVIICRGNHIKTIVNGITISDYDGTGVLDDIHHKKYGITKKGHIALQLHKNDQLKIAFKDIKIKRL